jgi:hypothetical protein
VNSVEALDKLGSQHYRNSTPLHTLMSELIRELAVFSPQRHVHAITLYSAVNMLRRCPPGPVFATLATHPDFVHVGGPYWQPA